MVRHILFIILNTGLGLYLFAVEPPIGFQNATWGMTSNEVRTAAKPQQWQPVNQQQFPRELGITQYQSRTTVAGYPGTVTYYFWQDRFFQASVTFDFGGLATYDFNYNVFRSVNEYFHEIRNQTLTFVDDIYALLRKKYGKKEPVFKGLDPRLAFGNLDKRIRRDLWNYRYNPYDYYQSIVTAAYARWLFPKTTVIFSINISAPDKRFDYMLSLTSIDFEKAIASAKDRILMQNL